MTPNLLNLTPHPIVLRSLGGDRTLPPSGRVARVDIEEVQQPGYVEGVKVIARRPGKVTGIPKDDKGAYIPCVVTPAVLAALPAGTRNVYAADMGPSAVRGPQGKVVAVTRLLAP